MHRVFAFICAAGIASAQSLQFPTANRHLLTPGAEEKFFVGTVGKPWTSGAFGCVRSGGGQFHEGIDIRALQRDRRGEPTDPVLATADGVVVYLNKKSALSNYGNYLILRHQIEGIEIYSLYAHLREIRSTLKTGQSVKAGETIATLGRTANTREGISRDRAHLHFELNIFLNDRFATWYKSARPGQRNDHGTWNGQNLAGFDPRQLLLAQAAQGKEFSLVQFIRSLPELCRVQVRDTDFPWLKRYAPLITPNPRAQKEGIAGYELALSYTGVPVGAIPRAESELKGKSKITLLSVNEAEQRKHPCRDLVIKRGSRWDLAPSGNDLLQLLIY